jgi:hypothetical protein
VPTGDEAALVAVVAALERSPDSESIQRRGIEALSRFCIDNPQHAELAREKGVAPLVVAALTQYPVAEVLQWRGLHVLGWLFHGSPVMCEVVLGVVVAALERSPDSEIIQENGLEALSRLCFGNLQHAKLAREQGAAPLVVAALTRYPATEEVQWRGLHVLGTLFAKSSVGWGAALDAVVAALECTPDSESFQQRCIETLSIFCVHSQHAELARERGAAPLVVAALARYPMAEQLQWRGLYVLGTLFTKSPVVCEVTLDVVVSALERSPDSTNIQERGIEALSIFCDGNPQYVELVREKGTVPSLVVAALTRYPTQEVLQWHGLHVLGTLFTKSSVGWEEAVGAVVAALERAPDSESIQWSGIIALSIFCDGTPQYAALVREKGAAPLVVAALARYPAMEELQCSGLDVLGLLFTKSKVGGTKHARETRSDSSFYVL